MDKRLAFVRACLRRYGEPVLMGGLDCSELVALGEMDVGLPDRRLTHRAQDYYDQNPRTDEPKRGDLGFWGPTEVRVVHVGIALDDGAHHVLSADGATKAVTELAEALRRGAQVRIHTGTSWYKSFAFLGWRRHTDLE